MLGVEPGKLSTYSNLLKFAIKPAFDEVNRLAEFHAAFEPVKIGRKVGAIKIAWALKGPRISARLMPRCAGSLPQRKLPRKIKSCR
ncbi:replication initiation protein [Paracoccus cavernae]|uniref:replication initiation protein n=1 Tax=Paracoccus cavernae TaxID=1571207 RepID=UPI003642AAC2